jgi:hypothetical protein
MGRSSAAVITPTTALTDLHLGLGAGRARGDGGAARGWAVLLKIWKFVQWARFSDRHVLPIGKVNLLGASEPAYPWERQDFVEIIRSIPTPQIP